MTLNNTEAFVVASCIVAMGIGFLRLGAFVVTSYGSYFRRTPERLLLWDILAVLISGPWSAPAVLAVMIGALGVIAIGVGSSVIGAIVISEISQRL